MPASRRAVTAMAASDCGNSDGEHRRQYSRHRKGSPEVAPRRTCARDASGKEKPRLHADSGSTEAYAGDFTIRVPRGEGDGPVELSARHAAALDRSITPTRMGTSLDAAHGDADRARELYMWDRDLAVAFLGDLAILEVALRNAMSARLEEAWGPQWYANPAMPLDDRSLDALSTAWGRITGERTPGKLVAQCMFGFWRGLLDKGDHAGRPPRRFRCDDEILWRGVLDKAFLGGRVQARADGQRWNREYALAVVTRVNELRNRVAHHEPLVKGLPLPGQQIRLSAEEAHADVLRLAAMLDRDIHSFLLSHSCVPDVLSRRP